MSLNFDPNNKKPPVIEWASYVPDRTTDPQFKPHTNRGHLLNAVIGKPHIAYHWSGEQWVEIHRYEKGNTPTRCYVCGKSLEVESKNWRGEPYMRNIGRWLWTNKKNFFPDMVRVCSSYPNGYTCERMVRNGYATVDAKEAK